MSPTWSILTAVTVLTLQLCIGEKSCTIWSSTGLEPVVQRGSTFNVYCTFKCNCKGSMYCDHPPTLQRHRELNSTTIYLNVVNITKNRTYSCQCKCPSAQDACGLDISVGYPPDRPKNISCIYKVTNNESGVVLCTWNQGRYTYLKNSWNTELWVRTASGNHTEMYKVSSKGTDLPTASFTVSNSIQLISVRVQVQNKLDSAESITTNYTLGDIVMPSAPALGQPKCSSRECIIPVKQSVRTQHLEIQYRAEAQPWSSYPDSTGQVSLEQVRFVSSLEPYRLYHFRARSKFSTGLWSQWSTNISSRTQEEAPARKLDVWYASDLKSLKVYWKEVNISIARGQIIAYEIGVYNSNSELVSSANISADNRNYSVPFCDNCEVTVLARNSKGLSPPARIITHHTEVESLEVVHVPADNHSVSISWRKPQTAPQHVAYVVEWYPEGYKLEELQWVRLGRNDNRAVITGMKPFECYEGAVYVVYNESSVSRTGFTGVTSEESAPESGPSVQDMVEGNKVKVTWKEIPRGQRRGCITNYTIYLENGSGHQRSYSIPASKRMYIIKDLSPAVYSLWMTASTAKGGEGPKGQPAKFFIQQDTQLSLLIVCGVVSLITFILLCLCQTSAVKQRFCLIFRCLMLDDVPDPANSKWAKECTQEKGKMKLQLQPSNSSVTDEEEPILVDIEELPKQSSDICSPANVSSPLPPHTSVTEPATLLYPQTTYIKSFSHDSDSSNHTVTSLDTTVDYISSHALGNMDEEDQEEEDEEEDELAEMLGFFPSHNFCIDSLQFGQKLTLDVVKIDCNDLFQNNF
ncbi:interleukin-12 receptor subunit beta-2 [Symphorus nematophorus]